MTVERHRRLSELFQQARALPSGARSAWLVHNCGDDRALLDELAAMLEFESSDSRFLERSSALGIAAAGVLAEASARFTPKTIGRYRVLEKLGEGGMGIVFAAEQDAPKRKVAVKLLRSAFASDTACRRFAIESEILARLSHPGIAKVYEAGVTEVEDGTHLPYFAMEFVDGPPITVFAAQQSLSTRARAELFLEVLDAIDYAHRKGVIHRDLKPLNVLVDPARQPKILDFGVARVLDAEESMHTRAGAIVGTVESMSPEHAAGQPADTRSDVFALGCILYELLSESRPRDLSKHGFTTSLRIVRDQPIGKLRKVAPAVPEDLAAITDHALESDPERRYPSAASFADDLRRWLRGEPIAARPPSQLYRLRRFVARHGVACAFATLALLALAAGFAVSWTMWRRAEHERAAAIEARANENAIHEYILMDMLRSEDPERDRRTLRVVDVLERAAEHVGERFRFEPTVESAARFALANYFRELGANESALAQVERVIAVRRMEWGIDGTSTLEAEVFRGEILGLLDRGDEALALFERVIAGLTSQRERPREAEIVLQTARLSRATILAERGKFAAAESELRDVVAVRERILGDRDRTTLTARMNLSVALGRQGKYEEAERINRDVLSVRMASLPQDHPELVRTAANLAQLLEDQRKLDDAAQVWRDLVAAAAKLGAPDARLAIYSRLGLAAALARSGDRDEALQLLEFAVDLAQRSFGPDDLDTLRALRERVRFAVAHEPAEAAVKLAEQLVAHFERAGRSDLPEYAGALTTLGNARSAAKDDAGALESYRRALAIRRREYPGRTPQVAEALFNVGVALRKVGDLTGAIAILREAIDVDVAIYGAEHVNVLEDRIALARALADTEAFDEAFREGERARELEQHLAQAAQGKDNRLSSAQSALLSLTLGRALAALGRDGEAEPHLRQAFDNLSSGGSRANFELARQELASLYERAGRRSDAERIRSEGGTVR